MRAASSCATSALTHLGIVTVHSIEREGDTDFIVMEYVLGRSLAETIPEGGLPIELAIDYPPSLSSIRPDVPAGLGAIVRRCLTKEPAQRYQSGELLDALTGLRTAAAAASNGSRRLSALVFVSALVIATIGIGAIAWTAIRARREASVRATVAETTRLANGGDSVRAYKLLTGAIAANPSDLPLFKMLGTRESDKVHKVLEGGHIPPKPQLVYKEILDWLDKYLGRVQ